MWKTLRLFTRKVLDRSKQGLTNNPCRNLEDSSTNRNVDYGDSLEASEGNNCGSPCKHHGQQQNDPGDALSTQLRQCWSKFLKSNAKGFIFTHLNAVKLWGKKFPGNNCHHKTLFMATSKFLCKAPANFSTRMGSIDWLTKSSQNNGPGRQGV